MVHLSELQANDSKRASPGLASGFKVSREAEFVLSTSRPGGAGGGPALAPPIDWHRLIELADRERAALPVWRAFRDSGADVQSDGARALRHFAQVWEFKLAHLERLLFQAVRLFADAGIEVVLLKGAAAALTVYDEFDQRPMIDLDILVKEDQAERAWRVAHLAGWKWDSEAFPWDAYQSAHHLPPLEDAFGTGSGLEIHRRLFLPGHPFAFNEEQLWAGSALIDVGGFQCRVPSLTHQLLHCCLHFVWSHQLQNRAWRAFRDVNAFAGSEELDWDEFVSLAKEAAAETCCYWTLRLAARATDADVPPRVLRALKPSGPDALLDILERHYLINLLSGGHGGPSVALGRRLWRLGVQRGPGSAGIDLPSSPAAMGVGKRVAHHLKQLPEWYRYFRRLV